LLEILMEDQKEIKRWQQRVDELEGENEALKPTACNPMGM
jgi:hypothetical protein